MDLIPLPTSDQTFVSPEFSQRALGAVLGSAAGDALGAPFEFQERGMYSAAFPEPVVDGIGEMQGGHGWEPGEFTDDTQMAIIQAESLLRCGGLDGADLFAGFQTWAVHAKDVGTSTREVLNSTLVGTEAAQEHYARTGRSAGNGTVMRAAPTAVLLAAASEAESVQFALATAAVTHGDPATGWGNAFVHVMLRAALLGEDPWDAIERLAVQLPPDQKVFSRILSEAWEPSQGVQLPDGADLAQSNGHVWGCLAQAVWAVRNHDSFHDAVVAAIDLGKDTDTVAAVAGGIAGAIHSAAAIPGRWTTHLHGTVDTIDGPKTYGYADLVALTDRLQAEGV